MLWEPLDAAAELCTLGAGRFAEQSCAGPAVGAERQPQEAQLDVEATAEALAGQTPQLEVPQAFQPEAERWQLAALVQQPVDAVERPLAAWEVELVSRPVVLLQPDAPEVPPVPLAQEERQLELLASQLSGVWGALAGLPEAVPVPRRPPSSA